VSIADALVCQGLDKLEEQAPVIKKSPDDASDCCCEILKSLANSFYALGQGCCLG